MTDLSGTVLNREQLRTTWHQVTGRIEVKDPVLRNVIKNPRIARRYGSDAGDYGFGEIGVRAHIAMNRNGGRRTIRAATS
jgi:hypothetical protein